MSLDKRETNLIMRNRIQLLQQELKDIMDQMEIGESLPRNKQGGIKRISSGFTLNEKLVNKIRNATREGHLRVVTDIEAPLWQFIFDIEAQLGITISDERVNGRLSAKFPRQKYTPAQLLVRQMHRQIKKLKEEYDNE